MKTTVTISKGQASFPALVKKAEEGSLVTITRHEQPVAFIVSYDRMLGLVESMEIMANPEAMKAIRDYEAGKMKFHRFEDLPK